MKTWKISLHVLERTFAFRIICVTELWRKMKKNILISYLSLVATKFFTQKMFSKSLSIERFPMYKLYLVDFIKNSGDFSCVVSKRNIYLSLKRNDIAAQAFRVHNMFTISINRLVYCLYRCTLSFLTFRRVSWP